MVFFAEIAVNTDLRGLTLRFFLGINLNPGRKQSLSRIKRD
jgi:hypothetical protein